MALDTAACQTPSGSAARQQLVEAAQLEHEAFVLDQEIERARSRARIIERKNRQLLQAFDADPGAGTTRERTQATHLVKAAEQYLSRFNAEMKHNLHLPSLVRSTVQRMRSTAKRDLDRKRQALPLAEPAMLHQERAAPVFADAGPGNKTAAERTTPKSAITEAKDQVKTHTASPSEDNQAEAKLAAGKRANLAAMAAAAGQGWGR